MNPSNIFLLASILSLVGCNMKASEAHISKSTGPPIQTHRPTDAVEVELKVAEMASDAAVIQWKITNHTNGRIWVPTHWGMSEQSMRALPMPMLAPPADVMLVFANCVANATGRHRIIEGQENGKTVPVSVNESVKGEYRLPLPVGEGKYYEDALPSPFSFPWFIEEEKYQLVEITGLQAAVRYFTISPDAWPKPPASTDPEYRIIAARVLIVGEKPDEINFEPFEHYALSPRIDVHLPVAHGLEIFYTAKP